MKTNVCVYVGPDNEPTAKIDDLDRPESLVPVARPVVNIWRDEETDELHVSVHATERVLVSLDGEWWESAGDEGPGESWVILHPTTEDALSS